MNNWKYTLILLAFGCAALAQAPGPVKPAPMGTYSQMMKGTALLASDLIFEVQKTAPKDEPGWKAVENASIAIAETANLLMIPGRKKENGQTVSLQKADWNKFTRAMVAAGQACLKAAQAKNQEAVSDCTNDLSESCTNCHEVYLDRK